MKITLNGEKREFEAPQTVKSLLAAVGLAGKPVVVEQNQAALLPREIETATVSDGDVIEIVQITAGGVKGRRWSSGVMDQWSGDSAKDSDLPSVGPKGRRIQPRAIALGLRVPNHRFTQDRAPTERGRACSIPHTPLV